MIVQTINDLFKKVLYVFSFFLLVFTSVLINLTYIFLFFCALNIIARHILDYIPLTFFVFFKNISLNKKVNLNFFTKFFESFGKKIKSIAINIDAFSQNYFIDMCSDKLYLLFQFLINNLPSYFNWIFSDYNIVFVMFNFVLEKSDETFENISDDIILIKNFLHISNNPERYQLKEIK